MGSPGIRCVQNHSFIQIPRIRLPFHRFNHHVFTYFDHSLSIPNRGRQKRFELQSSVSSLPVLSNSCDTSEPFQYNVPILSHSHDNLVPFERIVNANKERFGENDLIYPGKLDEWMQESVVEIVQNLRRAPLLLQVYSSNDGMTKLKTEKAVEGHWTKMISEWKSEEKPSPEGIIFVEELDGVNGDEEESNDCLEEGMTKSWGVVIQGKGLNCSPVCYLLKTCTVKSELGSLCTHFCLVKVQSFWESALSQLQHCWLM